MVWLEPLLAAMRPILAPAFTLLASPVTWLELIAFVLSIAMVLANLRVNPIGWPLAIVSSLLSRCSLPTANSMVKPRCRSTSC